MSAKEPLGIRGEQGLAILLLTLLLTGCRTSDVRVHTYWGTSVSRPVAGSVYDWSPESGHLQAGQDERLARAIQEDIEREMGVMGFVKGDGTRPPDILVAAHTGRGLQPSPSGPEQHATLSVRVYWANDGQLIYCASADALIDPTLCPEERRARLSRAVQEILRPLTPCPL